jgi:hypothetical protein
MEPKEAVLESKIDYVKMGINGKLELVCEFAKPYCQKVAIQYTGINEQLCKVHHDISYCHR